MRRFHADVNTTKNTPQKRQSKTFHSPNQVESNWKHFALCPFTALSALHNRRVSRGCAVSHVSSVADLQLWRWALLSHLCNNGSERVKNCILNQRNLKRNHYCCLLNLGCQILIFPFFVDKKRSKALSETATITEIETEDWATVRANCQQKSACTNVLDCK